MFMISGSMFCFTQHPVFTTRDNSPNEVTELTGIIELREYPGNMCVQ